MKTKTKIIMLSITTVIILMGILYYCYFYTMLLLPKGELFYSSASPNGTYVFNAYIGGGGATAGNTVRGEIVNNKTKEKRNIYWDYYLNTVKVKWINDECIIINNKEIKNIHTDYYDFREDENYSQEYNYYHYFNVE